MIDFTLKPGQALGFIHPGESKAWMEDAAEMEVKYN